MMLCYCGIKAVENSPCLFLVLSAIIMNMTYRGKTEIKASLKIKCIFKYFHPFTVNL